MYRYHYNEAGYTLLGSAVAQQFKKLLAMESAEVVEEEETAGVSRSLLNGDTDGAAGGTKCGDGITSCPSGSACAVDMYDADIYIYFYSRNKSEGQCRLGSDCLF